MRKHGQEADDLAAANNALTILLERADGTHCGFPFWFGWAIESAFLAGLEEGRRQERERIADAY